MKKCTKCNKEKDYTEFYYRANTKDILRSECKECFRLLVKDKNRKRSKLRACINKKVRDIKLEKGCSKCGFNTHYAALEFHHINPETKKFRLSAARNHSWKMVLLEIEKCEVFCANCHAILEDNKRKKEAI